jgi:hypothetical protein
LFLYGKGDARLPGRGGKIVRDLQADFNLARAGGRLEPCVGRASSIIRRPAPGAPVRAPPKPRRQVAAPGVPEGEGGVFVPEVGMTGSPVCGLIQVNAFPPSAS